MSRIDSVLVLQQFAESRSQAQRMIADKRVRMHQGHEWKLITKPAYEITDDALLDVAPSDTDKYVSRAGIKMLGALTHTRLAVQNLTCLDLGISTGGFTDCLLQHGARHVVGVDAGSGQLHKRLHGEPRLSLFENINARYLDEASLSDAWSDVYPDADAPITHDFDLIVADLSFISLTKVLPIFAPNAEATPLLKNGAYLLALVKPQFELSADALTKAGIVKNPADYAIVQANILQACLEHSFSVLDYFASPIEGGDGNKEFFIFAQYHI
ncbi:MAG: TlyA family RNA methyltransferase [Formosimonas sp.]